MNDRFEKLERNPWKGREGNIFAGKSTEKILSMCNEFFGNLTLVKEDPESIRNEYRYLDCLSRGDDIVRLEDNVSGKISYALMHGYWPNDYVKCHFFGDKRSPFLLMEFAYEALEEEANVIMCSSLVRYFTEPVISTEEIARRLKVLNAFYGIEKVDEYADTSLDDYYILRAEIDKELWSNENNDSDMEIQKNVSSELNNDVLQFTNFVDALEIAGIDRNQIKVNGKTIEEVSDMLIKCYGYGISSDMLEKLNVISINGKGSNSK